VENFETAVLLATLRMESPGLVSDEESVEVPLTRERRAMWEHFSFSRIFGSQVLEGGDLRHYSFDVIPWIATSC
jgi:hypothetical protein